MTPELWLVVLGWAIAGGSPGPATLAISATSMSMGRRSGLALSSGVIAGSASWGIAAGLGMSAVMLAQAWILEVVRYAGAAYLLWLAQKSLRRAWTGATPRLSTELSGGRLFGKGFLLHLTNPKAILSWGAIYAIALPAEAVASSVWQLFAVLMITSMTVFWGYALLFSTARISAGYRRASRGFDAAFGVLFGAASVRILTARITPA